MRADKVVIIGAGPAGITAAIQLKRYGIPFILLEGERVGGLLWNANLVENYPGFPAGVSGPKLAKLIKKQIESLGIEVVHESAKHIKRTESGFLVETSKAIYQPKTVVVASGTRPKPIPIPIPRKTEDKVFSDVYPLKEIYEKQIAIIGTGDAAFDYALNLVKKRNFVTILNRGAEVKCLGILWERAKAESAIAYRAETPVREVNLEDTGSRLEVRLEAGESLIVDYLLFAIGRVPQMEFLSAELIEKKVEGLYLIGDVKNGNYRQAAIAAGDGLRAAMEIYFKIRSET